MHKLLDRQDGQGGSITERPQVRGTSRRGAIVALVIAGLIVLLALWLQSRGAPHAPQQRFADAANVVRVSDVRRGDVPVALEALGTVTALSTVTVKTQISGKLTEVGFTEGQNVKAGDFLAQIDPRP